MTARIVHNHSTTIEGLVPALRRLAKVEGITTITPGPVRHVKGGNGCAFRFKIVGPTITGYRLMARHGHSAQVVFVVTNLEPDAFEAAVKEAQD